MDYYKWSDQYLAEAQCLQGRVAALRQQAKAAKKPETAERLRRQAELLDDMCLDCLLTGRLLGRRAARVN